MFFIGVLMFFPGQFTARRAARGSGWRGRPDRHLEMPGLRPALFDALDEGWGKMVTQK
jgi:hypothetical protein